MHSYLPCFMLPLGRKTMYSHFPCFVLPLGRKTMYSYLPNFVLPLRGSCQRVYELTEGDFASLTPLATLLHPAHDK